MKDLNLENSYENINVDNLSFGFVLDALEQNLWNLWSNFGLAPGCTLHNEGDILWFETPISVLPYNTVLKFIVEDNIDERIDLIINHFENRKAAQLWMVHPSSRPVDLAERLTKRGLKEIENIPGMAADISALPEQSPLPDGIEIHEVTSKEAADELFELIAWRWKIPDEAKPHLFSLNKSFKVGTPEAKVRCWLAWQNGKPVGKCVLNLANGVAGLYGVVTKPEARGLGIARNLTIKSLTAVHKEGYKVSVLHSTPAAESLYKKLGFREFNKFRLFASEEIHL